MLVGGVFGALFLAFALKDLPSSELLENRRVAESTKIYDRSGRVLLYEIHGEEKRTIVPFEDIPLYVKQATVAIEDINFYTHPAFDFKSMLRALFVNLTKGRIVQGGSTITQQLVKNAFLTPERTITRKIKELVLAFRLEKQLTKDQILNLYLNQVSYGSNAYGIEAASQTFFNKSARDLNLAEAALLAALPRAPSYYSPWGTHVDELIARKDLVLNKMFELGLINAEEREKAGKTKFKFAQYLSKIQAPHFVMMVQDYLNDQYGEDFIRTSGLKIITTLNWDLQQLAEKIVREGAERNKTLYEGKNAALVAQDAKTGQVLALVGSRDYFDIENEGNFNVAAQGLRQPGSAMKPFAYVTAFKKGFTPDTIVFDVETEFDTTGKEEKSYKPQNFDDRFRGPVTLRNALAQSINVPSVKVLYLAGINDTLKTAKDFGITTLTEKSRYGLSLVLGGGEVKLIDLVNAYSVFAREGERHKQALVLQIQDKDGKLIESYEDNNQRVIEFQYARLINDVLSDSEAREPLYQNNLGLTTFPDHDVALKTGTSNDYRDAWTIGYTPSLVVGVWAGNNDNSPMQKKAGSILAALPIWNVFMKEVLKTQIPETFNRPEQIFVDKPILKGNYVVNYEAEEKTYPQIHNILFYVNKNGPQEPEPKYPESDPQFENWEKPVVEWAKNNILDFDTVYNQPLPQNKQLVSADTLLEKLSLLINKPENGAFINIPIDLDVSIKSGSDIIKMEIYFNGTLVELKNENLGKNYVYRNQLNPPNIELQNSLKIAAFDAANNKTEKEIIVFKP